MYQKNESVHYAWIHKLLFKSEYRSMEVLIEPISVSLSIIYIMIFSFCIFVCFPVLPLGSNQGCIHLNN